MSYSYLILGKYAILQHNIASQLIDRRQTQQDKMSFFARFAHSNSAQYKAGREHAVEMSSETKKLVSLTKGNQNNLLIARTIFPFVLFADTLKIDRQKITIVHNDFLWSSQTASTEIKNIMNIQADVGIFFGTITITSKHFLNNTQTIRYLKKGDVARAQRLLQGFMIARRAKIDTDDIEKEQLLELLDSLGQENQG